MQSGPAGDLEDDAPVGLLANGNQLHYVQPDHLGTPRAVIDPVRNVAVWKWELKGEVFGNTPPEQDADGDGVAFVLDMRFPGQRYDATGLNQNGARDYDMEGGRYVQSDPIGLVGGISTYGYVGGNPVGAIDPSGLQRVRPPTVNPYTSQPTFFPGEGSYNASNTSYPADLGPKISGEDLATLVQMQQMMSPYNVVNPQSTFWMLTKALVQEACRNDDDECQRLNQEVQQAKAVTGSLGKCRAGMSWGQLVIRKSTWLKEASARARRDMKCWAGGDDGHQAAQARAWQNVGTCSSLMSGM